MKNRLLVFLGISAMQVWRNGLTVGQERGAAYTVQLGVWFELAFG